MTKIQRVKKSNHNKVPSEKSKIVEIYRDPLFMKEKPVSLNFLESLARDMIEWSKKDSSLRVSDYFLECEIPNQMIYRWMDKYDFLKYAHEITMARIASRREIGAITRKFDSGAIERYQPMYDPEYKKLVEWRASLSDKNKDSQGTLIVQMMPAPVSGRVPELKVNKDE